MQNNNQPPSGFQEFDPNKRSRSIRYVPIAANYPVRQPQTRSHSFMGQQITKPFGNKDASFKGGQLDENISFQEQADLIRAMIEGDYPRDQGWPEHFYKKPEQYEGTVKYPNKDMRFEDLTREQLRELSYMTDSEGKPAIRRADFGMRDGRYGTGLPAGISAPVFQLLQTLSQFTGGRAADKTKYDRAKKQNELSWLEELKMDKMLGVDNLEHKIPVDDPNRQSKIAYMDQVAKAYRNNIEAFKAEQENHRVVNQTARMREMLNKNRGTSTQKDPLTGKLIQTGGNPNATTREGLELNPIWRNIAQQMAGGGVGPGSMSPEQQTFFATDREKGRNYFDIDDFGIGAPQMNQLEKEILRPGISPFESTILKNSMLNQKEKGAPLPTMGHSFTPRNTRDLFQLPGVVAGLPEMGSTRPSLGESVRANTRQAGKEFVDFGRDLPLSSKLGLGGILATGAGALGIDALRRSKNSRPARQPIDEETIMRFMAGDMGPVKGRRLQQLKGRV